MEDKILTADDFLDPSDDLMDKEDVKQAMIEFAKIHVQQALLKASEEAYAYEESSGRFNTSYNLVVEKDSILNAYPESNIK